MKGLLSPLSLLLLCWGGTGLAASMALGSLDRLPLVQDFMAREHLQIDAFGWAGLSWLAVAVLAYAVGDLAARAVGYPRLPARPTPDLQALARLTFRANLILLGITGLWILLAAGKAGGLMALATAVHADSLSARTLLLETKLFTGMRLFYAALPATACLAAGLLATRRLPARTRALMWITLMGNTVALFVLPIVMSQRLLLLQLLLSSYIASCIMKKRVFGLQWLLMAAILFCALWVAREAITNPMAQDSALEVAGQKLLFYVINDMWNAFAPLNAPIPHTGGALTLEGVMFFTLTDQHFLRDLAPTFAQLDAVLGGGEFPFLTVAFVDFGIVGGALFVALCGFVIRRLYQGAQRSVVAAAVYAQFGAALMFSTHALYFTHQNFLFGLLLIWGMSACAERRVALPSPAPQNATAVFASRRRAPGAP